MGQYIYHLRQKRYDAAQFARHYYSSKVSNSFYSILVGIITNIIVSLLSMAYWFWRIMSILFVFDMLVITHHYFDGIIYIVLVFIPVFLIKEHLMDKWRKTTYADVQKQ
ncbi:hypothetical protein DY052_08375 [Apilactobacillus timberlakei]|uniref:hypothetical protein n=1 Tax=Apilactobacillus timberlakei TaxID=2008380 RepID=UPI0011262EA2|nr:hypothetical protein [Apilactobacillus timberlakei]TPR13005.1 hypothetical protein DY052_08375 [Apilactobacillus timberlakei]